jgi:hypothetical protein
MFIIHMNQDDERLVEEYNTWAQVVYAIGFLQARGWKLTAVYEQVA